MRRILTGDRPTGRLHLGHYAGAILNRVKLQDKHAGNFFLMVADVQALTDNAVNPDKVRENVVQVAMDNLAAGVSESKATIFIQSLIPEIAELTVLFMNLVSVARLERNPTVKTELTEKNFEGGVPLGFLAYPVSQAADILFCKANLVAGAGADQKPMIEQTNEIVDRFNRYYGDVFSHVDFNTAITGSRLVGTDGGAKMSKSLGNCIYLSDERKTIEDKVMRAYTDPMHIRVEDPGRIEGNVAFSYLDIFDPDQEGLRDLKSRYQRGGVGDVMVKQRLINILDSILDPIRKRRVALDRDAVMKTLLRGSETMRVVARETMTEVRKSMRIDY